MKKKIFLIALMVAMLVCVFAVSASAANSIIKLDAEPTLAEIHANPSAYVSHLDSFDSSAYKEKDASSVVVLSDLAETPTYYVYPAYYILERTSYYPSMANLNTAVTNSGIEGAFASFASTGQRGSNLSIIRIEIPSYITEINGNAKFEGSTNLKEIYFPTKTVTDSETGIGKEVACITNITGQDLFSSCSSLEIIHNTDKLPLGINAQANFSGCKKLKEFKFPAGVTFIAGSLFSNCSSLAKIEIPETVTSIGSFTFNNCSSITELVLPNGVTSVGKHAFGGCSKLEKIVMGASFTTFVRVNVDYETFSGCSNLKYIYLPATFADSVNATNNDFKTIFHHSAKTIYFVTENDYNKIVEIQNKFITTNVNSNISNAAIELYDEEKDYEAYQETLTKSVIVYGYSKCDAFYNGVHSYKAGPCVEKCDVCGNTKALDDPAHTLITEISYGKLTETGVKHVYCTNDGCKMDETVDAPVLFKFLGYSTNEENTELCVGYSVNTKAIEEYKLCNEIDINYGVVAAVIYEGDTLSLSYNNGNVVSSLSSTIVAPFNGEYAAFDFRLTGFKDFEEGDELDLKTLNLVMCAYAYDGEFYFIGSAEEVDYFEKEASIVTFEQIQNKAN